MRRGPVVAALLVIVGGIYFQVRGSSSEALTNSMPASYLTKNSAAKSVDGLIGTGLGRAQLPDPPSLVSQVTGTDALKGTHPKQHRVMLTWNPSEISVTGDEVIGYNVYRGNGRSTRFTRLNSDPVPTPDYVDEHVRSGHTYYYTTTAVNSSGRQSRPSNLVRVVIPFP